MKRKTKTEIKVTWKDAPGPPPFDEWARDGVPHGQSVLRGQR